MRACVWMLLVAAAALLAPAAAARRSRSDQDFEFDDDADTYPTAAPAHARRPWRYQYDNHGPLCRPACKKREACVLAPAAPAPAGTRAPPRAFCTSKKDLLRAGSNVVLAPPSEESGESSAAAAERDDDEDVFYDAGGAGAGAGGGGDEPPERGRKGARCVGCPVRVRGRGQFLCGSDNRTYSSLCRLDLHNCVRRAGGGGAGGSRPPVRLACRGFCPCGPDPAPAPAAGPAATPRRQHHRPRAHTRPAAADTNALRYYEHDWRRRKLESSHNEVLPEKTTRRRLSQSRGSEGCALDKMANRLLDWFSVVMEEAGARPPRDEDGAEGFPAACKPEVRWMFAHLDTDGDGMLSADNLYALRHDERERCLRPFLASCGAAGGGGVSRGAWCACMRRAARPCTALARAHAHARAAGAYVPACDARGYYRPRQCHAALAVCWCVDAHGVELPASRTKGSPPCPDPDPDPADPTDTADPAGEGAPDDDEDATLGSGDSELRF